MKKKSRPIHVVLTGPESSGKTTMTLSLSERLKGRIVEEYARDYLEKKNGIYSREDLRIMAFGQFSQQLEALNEDVELVISDTCLLTISIWEEWKYNVGDSFIEEWLGLQQVDLYLLCKPDIEWESDPLRESELDREKIFNIYEEKLKSMKIPYQIVSGEGDARLDLAIEYVQNYKRINHN